MSIEVDEEIKRWTARRKSALVLDIIYGRTAVCESYCQFDFSPSKIEPWIVQARGVMAGRPWPCHRLPRARTARLAALEKVSSDNGNIGARASVNREVRDAGTRSCAVPAEIGQRAGIRLSDLTRLGLSYGFRPKSLTPLCPQKNGVIERVIRTLKAQCVRRHCFETPQHASRVIGEWIRFCNTRRPH
jgi:hypothetical protein